MRFRNSRTHRRSGSPPFINEDFAGALSGRRPEKRETKPDHKALQLCHQVQRTLNLVLSGECQDELLSELHVTEVAPAPTTSHLLVHVQVPNHRSIAEAMTRLERVSARLRLEVARAITRKRAPELTFVPSARSEEVQP